MQGPQTPGWSCFCGAKNVHALDACYRCGAARPAFREAAPFDPRQFTPRAPTVPQQARQAQAYGAVPGGQPGAPPTPRKTDAWVIVAIVAAVLVVGGGVFFTLVAAVVVGLLAAGSSERTQAPEVSPPAMADRQPFTPPSFAMPTPPVSAPHRSRPGPSITPFTPSPGPDFDGRPGSRALEGVREMQEEQQRHLDEMRRDQQARIETIRRENEDRIRAMREQSQSMRDRLRSMRPGFAPPSAPGPDAIPPMPRFDSPGFGPPPGSVPLPRGSGATPTPGARPGPPPPG